jgi:hypothetical protein
MKFFDAMKALIETLNRIEAQLIAGALGLGGMVLVMIHHETAGQMAITGAFALLQHKPQQQ